MMQDYQLLVGLQGRLVAMGEEVRILNFLSVLAQFKIEPTEIFSL